MSRPIGRVRARRDLTSGPLVGTLLRLAAPLAVGHVLHSLYLLVDAYWLGKVSEEALAAPGVSMPLLFLGFAFAFGLGSAGTAVVAQHAGAGRDREADRAAAQTILTLCGTIATIALPTALLAPLLFRILQVPTEAIPTASGFFRIAVIGLIPVGLSMSYGSALRALGDTLTPTLIAATANVLNFVLDPLLIFGWGGFPQMGTKGAALATLLSQMAAAGGCVYFMRRGRAGLHVHAADLRPHWPTIRKIFSVGMPAAVGQGSTSVGFVLYMSMVNRFGTAAIDAFTVGFRLIHVFRAPTMAMAMAAAPVVGQALGADRPGLARRAVWVSTGLVAVIMLPPIAFLTLWGPSVARWFIESADVVREAGKFFLIVPASSYFFSVLMVLMAAFYGSGHTKPAMTISIVRVLVLRVPIAYVLGFVFGLGSMGVYAGMAAANVLCALLTLWLFFTAEWQKAVVPTAGDQGTGEAPPQRAGP